MLAAWYEQPGPAAEVLTVGEMPDPSPGAGEVRVRVTMSGINPGDTKKRSDWLGYGMPYPRVIPHSDGAGVIDAVGDGVDAARIGERVWIYGAQSYRAFGTAAQLTLVPADHAVTLPDRVSDEFAACLGISGITAHRAVFGDGPVKGMTVLVHGVLGGVGAIAAQLAAWNGATVIGTVRHSSDLADVDDAISHRLALDQADPITVIRRLAPKGVHRIIEVAFSDNAGLDTAVAAPGAVIAAYATRDPRPALDFWPMLFANLTIRLLGSDDFPLAAKRQAAADLTGLAQRGALHIPIDEPLPLDRIAEAHDRVDAGTRKRLVLAIPHEVHPPAGAATPPTPAGNVLD